MSCRTPHLSSLFAAAVFVLIAGALPALAAVPAGFSDALVANVGAPTALAFTPDGRLLITQQSGSLRIYQGGSLLATPALTIPAASICTSSEQGLLGVAVHPSFSSNRYIYLFYTFEKPSGGGCVNRVSRFTLPDSNVISSATELVLIDNMPSPNGNHNAGDLHFGKDGYLYISIGDGGCDYAGDSGCAGANDAARDEHVLTGKILRITDSGGIPPTNPFQGPGTDRCNMGSTTPGNKCQETFAWGLRNPFRFAFDPNAAGTRFFINDVGQGLWEEVDNGQAGADYGWNCREGAHTNSTTGRCSPAPPSMVNPIYEYRHNMAVPGTTSPGNCNSITGGAFVPNGVWPGFDGAYLFGDFVCGWIFRLTNSGGTWSAADFATNLGGSSAVHLRFGPFGNGQALYYTTYAGGGQVRRIALNNPAGNDPPTAAASGSPLSGPAPLTVTFDATGSSDPDPGDTLTYFWDFGDGTPEISTASLTVQHTYTSNGVYTVRLRARDTSFAFSAPVTLQVQPGNQPPSPVISSPAAGATFRVGQSVTLTGSASDPQDGILPASALSWTVILHHNDHTHPFLGPVSGNNIGLTAPAPEDLAATDSSYLEIRLTATDSQGLAATATRDFQPKKVQLTFGTNPAGLAVRLNGSAFSTPRAVTSWEGYNLTIEAPDQGGFGFFSWSDGGTAAHTIMTPASPAAYTATFQTIALDFFTLSPCRVLDTRRPVGPQGGPALPSGSVRTFPVTEVCGVPSTARAVAVNVTVVQPASAGFLTLFPADTAVPGTSTINFRPGAVRANNAVLPLGADGELAVLCSIPSGSTHLVLDVTGYYE